MWKLVFGRGPGESLPQGLSPIKTQMTGNAVGVASTGLDRLYWEVLKARPATTKVKSDEEELPGLSAPETEGGSNLRATKTPEFRESEILPLGAEQYFAHSAVGDAGSGIEYRARVVLDFAAPGPILSVSPRLENIYSPASGRLEFLDAKTGGELSLRVYGGGLNGQLVSSVSYSLGFGQALEMR